MNQFFPLAAAEYNEIMKRWATNHLRWITNIFCLFSLLVFVGSVAIWVRSYYVGFNIDWTRVKLVGTPESPLTRNLQYGICCPRGSVCFNRDRQDFKGSSQWSTGWRYFRPPPFPSPINPYTPFDRVNLQFGGFQFLYCVNEMEEGWDSQQILILPLWLFLPAAIPPFLWWRRWRKKGGRGFPVALTSPENLEAGATKTASH